MCSHRQELSKELNTEREAENTENLRITHNHHEVKIYLEASSPGI
jgi:hypothetical protein